VGSMVSDLMERVGQLIARRRKVAKMVNSAHRVGAIFIGVPRSIPDSEGSTVECVGITNLTLDDSQDVPYHFYHAFSPDLARNLEIVMRKHRVVITQ